jgi:hypothetical protein
LVVERKGFAPGCGDRRLVVERKGFAPGCGDRRLVVERKGFAPGCGLFCLFFWVARKTDFGYRWL